MILQSGSSGVCLLLVSVCDSSALTSLCPTGWSSSEASEAKPSSLPRSLASKRPEVYCMEGGEGRRGEQLLSLQPFLSLSKARVIRRGKFRFPELEVETQQWQTHLRPQSTSVWERGSESVPPHTHAWTHTHMLFFMVYGDFP